jgi:hypothetical protein
VKDEMGRAFYKNMGTKRKASRFLVGKQNKRLLGRPGHMQEDNIKMGLGEIKWIVMLRLETSNGLL